jgi:hypothetical protein
MRTERSLYLSYTKAPMATQKRLAVDGHTYSGRHASSTLVLGIGKLP